MSMRIASRRKVGALPPAKPPQPATPHPKAMAEAGRGGDHDGQAALDFNHWRGLLGTATVVEYLSGIVSQNRFPLPVARGLSDNIFDSARGVGVAPGVGGF